MALAYHVTRGLDVFDAHGDKLGSVIRVHPMVVEVKEGVLGLGRSLYVPRDAVASVSREQLYLTVGKSAVDGLGWRDRPPGLSDAG
jgi:hypothetical protein